MSDLPSYPLILTKISIYYIPNYICINSYRAFGDFFFKEPKYVYGIEIYIYNNRLIL